MKKIKCLVVDDELLALDILETYIAQTDFLKLEGRCQSVVEAIGLLQGKKIDLVFLDIQMPGISGIQFLRTMPDIPQVILTTAYPNYAIEAFELNVLDYLLKPFSYERFLKSITKFLGQKEAAPVSEESAAAPDFFYVRSDKQMMRVVLDDILYIESLRNHVFIHLENGSNIKTLNTINNIGESLPADSFIRIHRSYIIPVKKISQFSAAELKIGHQHLPIGRNYRSFVAQVLARKVMISKG
ncbi:MAG: response regulator transcription factor [Chitinophagaceae bacterium]|nr:response regulator transcription factor [Chitinophagaceae bacterium]